MAWRWRDGRRWSPNCAGRKPSGSLISPFTVAYKNVRTLGPELCKSQDVPGWIFHPDLACAVESLSLRHDHRGAFRDRDYIIQTVDLDVQERRALGITL